ncbi:hypothetical protein FHS86_003438 [Roseimarinus sediminis]
MLSNEKLEHEHYKCSNGQTAAWRCCQVLGGEMLNL